jgi:putative ABC transport system permease protein
MKRGFYLRMVLTNIRNNGKLYIPYTLASIVTVMMFYLMCFLTDKIDGAEMLGAVQMLFILRLGLIVVAIFSSIIILYTNSFLMKQRKKELGLFNILGMEKKHIGKLMALETLVVGGGSIIAGLLTGMLFSKLLLALVLRIVRVDVPFGFSISILGIAASVGLFAIIYLTALAYNLGHVHLANPISLLLSRNTGEKEPKTKWIIATISTLLLGAGYYLALTVKQPLDALVLFFVAVILVILGTYGLMTTGSIVLLKALRKNKAYYYKRNHFISVSSMMYRMKQNAIGLASICILSTMVLVTLSTTTSLYMGMKDAAMDASPRSIQIQGMQTSTDDRSKIDEAVGQFIRQNGLKATGTIKYAYFETFMQQETTDFTGDGGNVFEDEMDARVIFIPLQDYKDRTGSEVALEEGQALLLTKNVEYQSSVATFSGMKFDIVKDNAKTSFDIPMEKYVGVPLYFVIVRDEMTLEQIYNNVKQQSDPTTDHELQGLSYYYGFNVEQTDQQLDHLTTKLEEEINSLEFGDTGWAYAASVASFEVEFLTVYGGFFFIGIFLGILFTMATILIMYYKQISEGYEDRGRFEIMQKVGMEKSMIRSAIRSQVLTVFFMPLAAACIHIAFAFKMIAKLLSVLYMPDWHLFAITTGCTLLVFGVIYTLAYNLTARAYYKIVL